MEKDGAVHPYRMCNLVLSGLLLIGIISVLSCNSNHKTKKIIDKPLMPTPHYSGRLSAVITKVAAGAKSYVIAHHLNQEICFLIDMSLPSYKKRFFIYNLKNGSVIATGFVAHGSCGTAFLPQARFSNEPRCGCSSEGRYKIGYKYKGRFGIAYKLYGLDATNSNAFNRSVVLHGYRCVPDGEVAGNFMCNSLGCPMVSYTFLSTLSRIIDQSAKPVLLWIVGGGVMSSQ